MRPFLHMHMFRCCMHNWCFIDEIVSTIMWASLTARCTYFRSDFTMHWLVHFPYSFLLLCFNFYSIRCSLQFYWNKWKMHKLFKFFFAFNLPAHTNAHSVSFVLCSLFCGDIIVRFIFIQKPFLHCDAFDGAFSRKLYRDGLLKTQSLNSKYTH